MWDNLGPFWRRSFELAWESFLDGGVPVGCVITDPDGVVVAEGRSRVLAPPAVAHAEINALSELPPGHYPRHTIWSTLEPCFMCTAAVFHSHVGRIRFAAADPVMVGIERLPEISGWIANRWPERIGPVDGGAASFAGVLPLVWALQRDRNGEIARAYEQRAPSLWARANELIDQGTIEQLRDGSAEMAFAEIAGAIG